MKNNIQIKRVYQGASSDDGYRVLIDRLWPRGVSKEKGAIDEWIKEVAPSTDLRKWFNHESERFEKFKSDYINELKENDELLEKLIAIAKTQKLTLVYSAKNTVENQAVVLKEVLDKKLSN